MILKIRLLNQQYHINKVLTSLSKLRQRFARLTHELKNYNYQKNMSELLADYNKIKRKIIKREKFLEQVLDKIYSLI